MKDWMNRAVALLQASLEPPKHELNDLDWKYALSPDRERLKQHLIAFANHAGGGFFVYGMLPDGTAPGITEPALADAIAQITNFGRDALDPQITIDYAVETFVGARLLFVYVREASVKPVRMRGKSIEQTFIRSGGTTRTASRQEIGMMMLNSRTPRWEELRATTLLTKEELLARLSPSPLFEMTGAPIPTADEQMLEWMVGEGFVDQDPSAGGYVTNLGAIAAANRLGDFGDLARKAVRVIVYDGFNKSKAKQEQEGARGYAISFQRLLRFVMSLLPQNEVIEKALRQKKTLYPEIALREIIANALIHQDFSVQGAGPLIELFDDRISVTNPGGLLPSKSVQRLIGTPPESRNERLARAFRMYKICEERGSGLVKAGLEVELYGLPPIHFASWPNSFTVTLYAPRTFAQMSQNERLDACYQHTVLKLVSGSAMTNKSLRERLNMPERHRSMVSVLIQEALDLKLIKAADPDNKSKKFAEYIPFWA